MNTTVIHIISYNDADSFYNDADIEQADLEAAGNEAYAAYAAGDKLRAQGNPFDAAKCCPHGAGYGLGGSHARDVGDPLAGDTKAAFRCTHCGSAMDADPWDGGRILSVDVSTLERD